MSSRIDDTFEDIPVDEEQGRAERMKEAQRISASSIVTFGSAESAPSVKDVAKEQNHFWWIVLLLLALLALTVFCIIIILPFAIQRGSRSP
jgi:type IV secretory pathway component VirB8